VIPVDLHPTARREPTGGPRLISRIALVGALAVVLVLFFLNPETAGVYPVCLFHRLTGLDCPSCGSLRALHALLHGHWASALRDNLMLVVSLPLLAWVGSRLISRKLRGGPAPAIRPAWLWLWLCAWLAFGVLRNLPIPALALLRP
jgi:hypothetical protein